MLKIILFLFLLMGGFLFSQEPKKTSYSNAENILINIVPNERVDSWTLIYNVYARDRVVKSSGNEEMLPVFQGFQIGPHQEGYFYINYVKDGKTSQITDLQALKQFVGIVDNGDEAAIIAAAEGYVIDFGFKDYTANYYDAGAFYVVDAGKVLSEECPLQKNHYEVWIDKKTGKITQEKELGTYFELYGKECTNNPHYDALKLQMEDVKKKAEEQKEIQKKMTEKMKKRLQKLRRKN